MNRIFYSGKFKSWGHHYEPKIYFLGNFDSQETVIALEVFSYA